MSRQRPLFPNQQIPSSDSTEPATDAAPAPVWLQRLSLFVLVLFCIYIGALMVWLPWAPRYWDQNTWLLAHPGLRSVLQQGWARGILSGFGLLDIWIGLSEAFHYRDYRPYAAHPSGSSDV
jgi:hypothetical protein